MADTRSMRRTTTGPRRFAYPVSLDVAGRRAVVVGEEAVGIGKADALLAAGALVTVVAEGPAQALQRLREAGATVARRGFDPADLDGAFVCVAASDDPQLRAAIFREARSRGVLVNLVDDTEHCDFAAPAVMRRGELVVAVSTGGRSPALASRLRRLLEERFGPEWEELAALLGEVREQTVALLPDVAARERAGPGVVHLVGAGPGDPELLTLRGAKLLARADVVVYDRLAPRELLELAPAGAELVDAGKAPGRRGLGQEAINRLLVERARAGATVVRLKGGDPFVFGRGGEEALACVRAGVPFEVVPGISAALAAPAYAGVPLTHRELAASFAVVTASLAGGRATDLEGVAGAADTLVVLMAAERLEAVCRALLRAGRPAGQPAVIVQWAATDRQRSVRATLEDLPALAAAAGIGPPATLVVGRVASLADSLAAGHWLDQRVLRTSPGA